MSIIGTNKLVQVPRSDWTKLRDLYAGQRTLPCAFGLLQTTIYCTAQNPQLDIAIYALNGDWKQDGTFVMKYDSSVFVNTLSDNLTRLIDALGCLDLQTKYTFAGIPERLLPAIEHHFKACGLKSKDYKPVGTFWYHIPKEQVEKFAIDPPKGVTVAKLGTRHAEQINSLWPHNFPGSVDFVKQMIRYNESVGAFDAAGRLIAWSLQLPLGSLGLVHVEQLHRRRGLGQLVVRCMANKLAAKKLELMGPVVFPNVASRSMFEKLGARVVDKAYWIQMPINKTAKNNADK